MQLVFDHPEPPPFADLLYFSSAYGHIQDYQNPVIVRAQKGKNPLFWIKYEQRNSTGLSLAKSPFGGLWMHQDAKKDDFYQFIDLLSDHLKTQRLEKLTLVQPPTLYRNAVPCSWMLEAGLTRLFIDQNQHLDLTSDIKYHDMQIRRLKKLEKQANVAFVEMHGEQLGQLYEFLAIARRQQGLQINLDAAIFKKLHTVLQDHYRGFGVLYDGKIIAGLFLGYVTDQIAYYFLPGSDKTYHHLSPMVFLIDRLLIILRKEGFSTLDMGVSSIEGKLQQGLFAFKERMGAQAACKSTFILNLD